MNFPKSTSRKTKLFGDNRLNFYGWVAVGISVMGASLWEILLALRANLTRSPSSHILLAIYFILLGHFGLALQNYCARVAKSLDEAHGKTDAVLATEPAPNALPNSAPSV